MVTVFFILSIIFFITTFGIHSMINNRIESDKPMYLSTPLILIPLISGLVLPVIPLSYLFEYHWLAITIVNFSVVWVLGPFLTKAYLIRLSTGILAKDMLYSFGLGSLALTIGLMIL